jgi:hypothetical protein
MEENGKVSLFGLTLGLGLILLILIMGAFGTEFDPDEVGPLKAQLLLALLFALFLLIFILLLAKASLHTDSDSQVVGVSHTSALPTYFMGRTLLFVCIMEMEVSSPRAGPGRAQIFWLRPGTGRPTKTLRAEPARG